MLKETYTPKLTRFKAIGLYTRILDFLLLSEGLSYNRIVKFRKEIAILDYQQDKEELKRYFNQEFGGYFISKGEAWDYYKDYEK